MVFVFANLLQAAPAAQQGGGASMWIMLALIFVIMYLFMIRPQRKQQKEMEKFRNSLKKGDKVITAGGIYGTVAEIKDNAVIIKVDGEVKLKVDKSSISKDPAAEVKPEQKAEEKKTEEKKEKEEKKAEEKK